MYGMTSRHCPHVALYMVASLLCKAQSVANDSIEFRVTSAPVQKDVNIAKASRGLITKESSVIVVKGFFSLFLQLYFRFSIVLLEELF